MAPYREQTVEIALGPKGAFENGNIGALKRRMLSDKVVSAVLPPRGNPKPSKVAKTPRVVELLRKAIEWQVLLESGEIVTEIARTEGITRARVTQVMGLLRLAPEIRRFPCPTLSADLSLQNECYARSQPSPTTTIRFGSFTGSWARRTVFSYGAEGGTRTPTGFPCLPEHAGDRKHILPRNSKDITFFL